MVQLYFRFILISVFQAIKFTMLSFAGRVLLIVFEHYKHFFRFDRRLIRPRELRQFSRLLFQISEINIPCRFSYGIQFY